MSNPSAKHGAAELRRNPVNGKWTVIAPGRGLRPTDLGRAATPCPFCGGSEHMTPPEVDALREPGSAPDGPGWHVRVVPNKFPVFAEGHEVIVHSPQHELELEDLEPAAAADVLAMYQRRLDVALCDGAAAATIIANRGVAGGASLAHPHSQLFATAILPPLLQDELGNFDRHRNRYGTCVLCVAMDEARHPDVRGDPATARLVFDGPVVAWTPLAPRFPGELWLAPADHQTDFRQADVAATAQALRRALAATAATADGAFNYWLHTAPADLRGAFHWHFEIAPRRSAIAGFELGSDMAICGLDPWEAAARLRAALT
jgi:UDPglucose--hexose-1-phosphate uridylyltransferase